MATDKPRRRQGKEGGDAKSDNRRGSVHLKKRHPEGTVNRESWLLFLEACLTSDDGRLCFQGQPINETHARTLYRWRYEGATPLWYKVDAFLCKYGGNFMDFELWCLTEEKPMWQDNEPTWWNEEPEDS